MLAVQFVFALLFALLLNDAVNAQNPNQPILMDRREVGAIGDIVTELKGKSMGGRMRFGKRGLYIPRRPIYSFEDAVY